MWKYSKWRQVASNGLLSSGVGGDLAQVGDSSGHGELRTGENDKTINPALQILGVGWEDVVHDQARECGEVLDGILAVVGAERH